MKFLDIFLISLFLIISGLLALVNLKTLGDFTLLIINPLTMHYLYENFSETKQASDRSGLSYAVVDRNTAD